MIGLHMTEPTFRNDADHCDRMAAIMLSKGQRDSYLELASMWRRLADEVGSHRQRVDEWTRRTERTLSTVRFDAAGGLRDAPPVGMG